MSRWTIPNPKREVSVLHRSGITAALAANDKLVAPSTPTVANVLTDGVLLANTLYRANLAAGNSYGITNTPATASLTTANDGSNTHTVRMTIAQVTDAEYYDLFLSTDAAPKWVARITEAQRAAGCTVTAVGTVSSVSPGAGLVDIRVVGTGVGSTTAPFSATNNNAFRFSHLTPIVAVGYSVLVLHIRVNVIDLRSDFAGAYVVWAKNATDSRWYRLGNFSISTLGSTTGFTTTAFFVGSTGIYGASEIVVTLQGITGQGTTIDIIADLA